ncbi:hypothetical protein EZV62_004328 [Acer yangbiense]|uniref:signal-recognition-particle GTPase n=1 Tax=Acer yangbiense TaxID=1000413 RepID=A0A5C7IJE0_9ROSI|nr:hypothetical protein EZV62_004328 [Acer yangbiense]
MEMMDINGDYVVDREFQPRRRLEFKGRDNNIFPESNTVDENEVKDSEATVDLTKKIEVIHGEIDDKLIPKVGMKFQTEAEAYDFYNAYTYMVGFSIGKSKGYKEEMCNHSSSDSDPQEEYSPLSVEEYLPQPVEDHSPSSDDFDPQEEYSPLSVDEYLPQPVEDHSPSSDDFNPQEENSQLPVEEFLPPLVEDDSPLLDNSNPQNEYSPMSVEEYSPLLDEMSIEENTIEEYIPGTLEDDESQQSPRIEMDEEYIEGYRNFEKLLAAFVNKLEAKMVLAQLGGSISRAIQQMSNATIIDEKVLNECLNEITRALLQSDVQFKLVRDMQTNIKKIVNLDDLAAGHNKRKIIQQAIFNELCTILDPGKPSFTPKKGKASVIMFVGLQGSGKTTTCTKYAYYHQKKGWKPALVCADTFRAGAFDQLKQNATKAKIPFYGSYTESDPVRIAVEGVERFKQENCDLIIVDTSGRHKQEASLFEEMRQVAEATKPDLVIFVMDSSIGQAAFDQAQAFKQSVSVGAVIITKMDGHAKGGGALSAVAATKSPVIFIGTGEHIDEFEVFDVKPFVSRLLGMGDWSGFMDKIHEVVPMDQQPELLQKLSEGNFTLRIMYEQFQNILKMGPIGQVFSMLPGFSAELMPKELDNSNPKLMTESRIMRIARGSGRPPREVMDMLEEYKRLAKVWSKMKGLKIPKKGEMSALSRNMNAQQMSKVLPQQMLKQIGGMGGLQGLMKQMGSMGGSAKDMMGMFGGADK